MRYIASISVLALAFGLVANHAFAGTTNPDGHVAGASPSGQAIPDPSGGPEFQFSANSDQKTASITATFNLPPLLNFDLYGVGGAQRTFLSITGQTPVGQDANFSNVTTLDGLSKSTSIALKFTYLDGGFNPDATGLVDPDDEIFKTNCVNIVDEANGKPHGTPIDSAICDISVMNSAIDAMGSDAASKLAALKKADDEYKNGAHPDPAIVAHNAIVESVLQAQQLSVASKQNQLRKKAAALWADETKGLPAPIWLFSFNGKVGYEQHTYYDPTSLAKSMMSKTPFQLGVEQTIVSSDGIASLNLSFNYQDAFQDSNKGMAQTKCLSSPTPILTCVNGFIGAPTETHKELVGLDIRWIPTIELFGSKIPIGFDPGFTYDAANHSEAVQFPVYFFTSSSKQLSGGIRYDWTSVNHQSVVGIFVSAAFGILPDASVGDTSDSTPKGAGDTSK